MKAFTPLIAALLAAPSAAAEAPARESALQWGITTPMGLSAAQLGAYQVEGQSSAPLQYLETRSARSVTLGLASLDTVPESPGAAGFRLSEAGDASGETLMRPVRIGRDRQVIGYDDDMQPLFGARLHLLFPRPLQPETAYRLSVDPALTGGARSITLTYHPQRISGSIQVNQVGYAPDAPKFAVIGNWLGSAGPMPIDDAGFQVIDSRSGKPVFAGTAERRAIADPWSGNEVFAADFTNLETPGEYHIKVPGVGVSDQFRIAPDVYDPVYRGVMRLFYHSRNSIRILAPWADPGHERPEGGIPAALDGVYHAAVAGSVLGCAEPDCRRRRVARGWFDAGDYGQYVPNAAPVWYYVGAGLDLTPGRFRDGDLRIPESGNGIPDVLDELEWGMDWMLAMQDSVDGGVYFRIASASWDDTLPHRLTQQRLIAEKTTHATASFAAAAAIHARLLKPYREARARQALTAAERAWQFLETHPQWPAEGERYKNPKGVHAGEYAEKTALDNRLWAAAELYRTTGNAGYRTAYERLAPKVHVDPTNAVSYDKQALAAFWAYLMSDDAQRDPTHITQACKAMLESANWRIRMATDNAYRAPVHHFIGFVGWGSFAQSTRATIPLLQAYKLSGEQRLLDWAWQSPNPQLGVNPQSLSYITGFGKRSPRWPLSKLSQYDDLAEPLTGIPVPGPHWHIPASWPQMAAVNAAYLPPDKPSKKEPREAADFADAYPALRRYTDSQYLPHMSEPTVANYAETGIAFGLLREAGLGKAISHDSCACCSDTAR